MSLSSRLRRARVHAERPALPSGVAPALPRRLAAADPPPSVPTRPAGPVMSAMERFVERERPGFQVERAAALASVAARRLPHRTSSAVHLPGNAPEDAGAAGPRLAAPLPRITGPTWTPVPSALDLLAQRANGRLPVETIESGRRSVPSGSPVFEPCAACGGPTRVATVDLVGDTATFECVACGLRRVDVGGGTEPGAGRSPAATES